MSEPNQEPTMEEILASIRRIISEDDAPPEAAEPEDAPHAVAPAAPEPEEIVAHAPPAAVEAPEEFNDDDEVLELTDRVDADEPDETHGDLDVYASPEPDVLPTPTMPPARPAAARAADEDGPLVGRIAEASAASAFGQLSQRIAMPMEGRTLEDVVRELLRPLLKAWLDEHLPGIVQTSVDAEVERIARGGGR